jgi:hypothetical protein
MTIPAAVLCALAALFFLADTIEARRLRRLRAGLAVDLAALEAARQANQEQLVALERARAAANDAMLMARQRYGIEWVEGRWDA